MTVCLRATVTIERFARVFCHWNVYRWDSNWAVM